MNASLQQLSRKDLKTFARQIRRDVLRMIYRAQSSHVASCLSIVEILTVLYACILRVDPRHLDWPARDRFILSKGHACAALYAILAEYGFFPRIWLDDFYRNHSKLPGHATHTVPGVEVSTGSLGHGLSIACGMALSASQQGVSNRIFVLLSDGECDEGSVWEAMLFAAHHQLDNLVAIVDDNKVQSLGNTRDVLNLVPLAEKWRSCNWSVREVDGHNLAELEAALVKVPFEPGAPSCLIAHTVKGKGVSFMENHLLWHYRAPNDQEFTAALAELGPSLCEARL